MKILVAVRVKVAREDDEDQYETLLGLVVGGPTMTNLGLRRRRPKSLFHLLYIISLFLLLLLLFFQHKIMLRVL